MIENVVTQQIVADILSVSKATLKSWEASGKLRPLFDEQGKSFYRLSDLADFEPVRRILNSRWREESLIRPSRVFTSVELFAGAGGLALGLENAGFHHFLVNSGQTHTHFLQQIKSGFEH